MSRRLGRGWPDGWWIYLGRGSLFCGGRARARGFLWGFWMFLGCYLFAADSQRQDCPSRLFLMVGYLFLSFITHEGAEILYNNYSFFSTLAFCIQSGFLTEREHSLDFICHISPPVTSATPSLEETKQRRITDLTDHTRNTSPDLDLSRPSTLWYNI